MQKIVSYLMLMFCCATVVAQQNFHKVYDYQNRSDGGREIIEHNNKTKEWVFMSPNLMLYSCMGFLTGIKNKYNDDKIDYLSEILFEKTIEVVERTSAIIENLEYEQSKKEKIELIKIKRNEHSN